MAETLGSLCDKLTIVKLKQHHCLDAERASRLEEQDRQLADEINTFFADAVRGAIPPGRLMFHANKVYRQTGNETPVLTVSSLGSLIAELAKVNCDVWHVQEKVYEFESVPMDQKDKVVKQLALLNLRRTQCVDAIDQTLLESIAKQGPECTH